MSGGPRQAPLRYALLALVLLAFAAAFVKACLRPPPSAFALPTIAASAPDKRPQMRQGFVTPLAGPHRHAPSLVDLGDGRLRAFWFSGSREGAQDVEIRSALLASRSGQWSAETTVADRQRTQRALWRYVKKLGNPVAERASDGTLTLYYVTVSLGGWAGSSISAVTSRDDGQTWSAPRRLVTSPFINISTLVKGPPLHYADGTVGLPVYHEFIAKFGELLRIDRSGKLIDKQRLSHGKAALQPVVLPVDGQNASVFMRQGGGGENRVIASTTLDSGRHWAPVAYTALANPGSALSGVSLPGGELLLALNNVEANRDALSLVVSRDGGAHWRTLYTLENQRAPGAGEPAPLDRDRYAAQVRALALATDPHLANVDSFATASARQCVGSRCSFEFSYPYLVLTERGDVHLVYTWNRSFIKHVGFSRAWIERRIGEVAGD